MANNFSVAKSNFTQFVNGNVEDCCYIIGSCYVIGLLEFVMRMCWAEHVN